MTSSARLLLTLALATCCGCQTIGPLKYARLPWGEQQPIIASRYQTPARLVAIWTDASYNSTGKKPVRGFGGRIYFYNEKQEPVPVEGQLVVYAYDDSNPRGPSQHPARKYVFTAEQLTEHYGETELGASYSIWLPWDELGGEQKSISLVPILTASSGQVLTGAQSLNVLPGTPPAPRGEEYFSRVEPESAGARRSLSKVQPASFQEPATSVNEPQAMARMETTTIRPTGSLAEQLLARRNEAIVQRALQRSLPQQPGRLPPVPVEASAPAARMQPAAVPRFTRRPGEQFPSRIYSGSQ